MKSNLLLAISLLLFAGFLFHSSANGPAAAQGLDLTGSPLSPSGQFCSFCHSAGAFSPSLSIQLLDGGTPVTQYVPGQTYQLNVTVQNNGASRFGFQAVALVTTNNTNAGAFGVPPSGVRRTQLNGRTYAEHNTPATSNNFTIDWTAPAQGTGTVRFYSAGVAANNSSDNFGDGAARTTLTLTEGSTSNVKDPGAAAFDVKVLGNPVQEQIFLKVQNSGTVSPFFAEVFDLNGRVVISNQSVTPDANGIIMLPAGDFSSGIYLIRVSDGKNIENVKIFKL